MSTLNWSDPRLLHMARLMVLQLVTVFVAVACLLVGTHGVALLFSALVLVLYVAMMVGEAIALRRASHLQRSETPAGADGVWRTPLRDDCRLRVGVRASGSGSDALHRLLESANRITHDGS